MATATYPTRLLPHAVSGTRNICGTILVAADANDRVGVEPVTWRRLSSIPVWRRAPIDSTIGVHYVKLMSRQWCRARRLRGRRARAGSRCSGGVWIAERDSSKGGERKRGNDQGCSIAGSRRATRLIALGYVEERHIVGSRLCKSCRAVVPER